MAADKLLNDLRNCQIDGSIIDPTHSDFENSRRVWNAMADRRPAVVVQARSVQDIEKVVRAAAEHGALLAIRGGGHSLPGLSTCDGGIMLSLSQMNSIVVDVPSLRAEAQGGALLGDLDRALVPSGFVVPAGVVSHTGVAGLTLGGGMGWLSRRLGLSIDSLIAADIVTADGRSRRVSATEEPDLFWAIRGGGGNFGVVTKFVFRMHPLGNVLIGSWVYRVAESVAVLRRYRELVAKAPRELSTGFNLTSTELLVTAIWSGGVQGAESAVAAFGKLGDPASGSIGGLPFLDLQRRSDDHMAWNRRYYAKGGYLKEVDDRAIERMVTDIASAPSPDADFYVLQLGGAIADIDDDATAYTGRAASHYWLVESGWDQQAHDDRFVGWSRKAAARLAEISMSGNYVNEQSDFGTDVRNGRLWRRQV